LRRRWVAGAESALDQAGRRWPVVIACCASYLVTAVGRFTRAELRRVQRNPLPGPDCRKSSGNRWLSTFNVVVALRWPSSFCTVTTGAPDCSASDPAEWRSVCGVTPGTPRLATARSNRTRNHPMVMAPRSGLGNRNSAGSLPSQFAQLLGQRVGQDRHDTTLISLRASLEAALTTHLRGGLTHHDAALGGVDVGHAQRGALAEAQTAIREERDHRGERLRRQRGWSGVAAVTNGVLGVGGSLGEQAH